MVSVPYKDLVQHVSVLANFGSVSVGLPSTLNSDAINLLINRRTMEYWRRLFWPDLMRLEKRQFRTSYSAGTTYQYGTEVYYPPTSKYYIAVRTGGFIAQAPATSAGATQTAYWQDSLPAYTGSLWISTSSYTVGTIVQYDQDGEYYACYIAAAPGVLPTNTANWGKLVRFVKSIALVSSGQTTIGDVMEIYSDTPNSSTNWRTTTWSYQTDQIVVDGDYTVVWLRFRVRPSSYTGAAWVSTTTYAAADQVYYDTTGEFYSSNAGGNLGNTPTVSGWTKIDYPQDLGRIVAQAVYSDLLRRDGQNDRSIAEHAEAERLLAVEVDRYERQQRQNSILSVGTR